MYWSSISRTPIRGLLRSCTRKRHEWYGRLNSCPRRTQDLRGGNSMAVQVQYVVESDAGMPGSVQSPLFHRRRLGAVICLLLLVAVSGWLAAQTVTSTLQGRIPDTTGAVIPEASVTALNADTGLKRTVTANAVG